MNSVSQGQIKKLSNQKDIYEKQRKNVKFESISDLESFALIHHAYSTPFNDLLCNKMNKKKKRVLYAIIIFNWILVIEIILLLIPSYSEFITCFIPAYTYLMHKNDRNSMLISGIAYLTTVHYFQTDFAINESTSYYLYDINLLKNGCANRLNNKKLKKIRFRCALLYQTIKFICPMLKLMVSLFTIVIHIVGYFDNKIQFSLLVNMIHCICWVLTLNHTVDVALVHMSFIILSVNYLKFRFDQINEKLISVFKNRTFKYKHLLKLLKEHKSIEMKTQLYNASFDRQAGFALIGLTSAAIASLYIICGSPSLMNRILSFLFASSTLLMEIIILIQMVSLTQSAHKPHAIINSFLVKKKMTFKTKLKVKTYVKRCLILNRINTDLQIVHFIEHLTDNQIGFYVFNFIPFNTFKFYEVRNDYFIIRDYINDVLIFSLLVKQSNIF